MKTGAVIIAASLSTRAQEFKPLIKIGNMTIASRVVSNLRAAGITDIVMVTGYRADELEKELKGQGITFLRNEAYATSDMFDSVRIGLTYLMNRADRIILCPGGVPFFYDTTLRAELSLDAPCVIPRFNGKRGHPILIDTALIPDILKYRGDQGLRGALTSCGIEPLYIDVDDEGTIINASTPEELKRVETLNIPRNVHPSVKLQLVSETPFFGPGTVTLFLQIDRLGSVREACERTGISYSKGWKMISGAEKALGTRLIDRQQGGKNGGAAVLTNTCRDIISRYELLNTAVMEYARAEYEKAFGDMHLVQSASQHFGDAAGQHAKSPDGSAEK